MALEQLSKVSTQSIKQADPAVLRTLSDGCFLAGFASIAASIAIWAVKRSDTDAPHAERFGIFVGLWAPTFFILSNRFERYAERSDKERAASTPTT